MSLGQTAMNKPNNNTGPAWAPEADLTSAEGERVGPLLLHTGMSWHYSRALVEVYLEATCLGGDAFAQSNGNPTPQAYLSPDRMKAFSRLSRFGMTCEALMEGHGEALLTWYLAGFHVRTSVQPERERTSSSGGPPCMDYPLRTNPTPREQ